MVDFVWPASSVWRAWQTRGATGTLTSKLLRDDLRAAYGDEWRAVASDLDNAIAEYGGWVDGKIHDRIERYHEKIRESNKGRPVESWDKPDKDWMRLLVDEQIQYWVHGVVRQYIGAAGAVGGALTQGKTGYQEKTVPATYDPMIDFDFTVKREDEFVVVWLDS